MKKDLKDCRINDLKMTTQDAVLAMCGGNPGAIIACTELLTHSAAIDPQSQGLFKLLELDSMGIYEERIYMLWSDVCGRDVGRMIAVLRANQLGQLGGVSEQSINYAIDHYGQGIAPDLMKNVILPHGEREDVQWILDRVVALVRERLPDFNPGARAWHD